MHDLSGILWAHLQGAHARAESGSFLDELLLAL